MLLSGPRSLSIADVKETVQNTNLPEEGNLTSNDAKLSTPSVNVADIDFDQFDLNGSGDDDDDDDDDDYVNADELKEVVSPLEMQP